jgi:pimeloyl-ACP methyl ester carboxylesterase
MWLGAHAPERIERLVLACTAPRFPRATYLERAELVRAQGLEPIADAVVERWVEPGNPHRAWLRELLLATPPGGYARCCEAIAEFDARDFLAEIRAPTLVLHGADDPAVTRADLDLLTDRIPDARLVVLDGARHLANVDRPDAFAAAVLEFLP